MIQIILHSFLFHEIYNYCRLNSIYRRCYRFDQFFFHYYIIYIYIFFHSLPIIIEVRIIMLISLQTLMSVLRIPTTAVGTMPLVKIQRDCSIALVILDSAGMDTTVQV